MNEQSSTDSSERARARMEDEWNLLAELLIAGRVAPPERRQEASLLPLTVITGFLGAGKTTLVNNLLTNPGGRRILVLVNDFGAINIDQKLIRSQSDTTISLTNGCACCSLAADLTRTLIDICNKPNRPDAVVLEASGVADPRSLTYVAAINPGVKVDGVVTVLDTETIQHHAEQPSLQKLIHSQIACADLLVANKIDLLTPAKRKQALNWLHRCSTGQPVIEARQARVPADILLGLSRPSNTGFSVNGLNSSVHVRDFESCTLASSVTLDARRINDLFAGLPSELLRAKGVLQLSDNADVQTVYQRVGKRWSFDPGGPWAGKPASYVVLIAPRGVLNVEDLQRQFATCKL